MHQQVREEVPPTEGTTADGVTGEAAVAVAEASNGVHLAKMLATPQVVYKRALVPLLERNASLSLR